MAFKEGDKVQSKSDPSKVGLIEELGPIHAGLQYYTVFWGGIEGSTTVPEIDLQLYHPAKTPVDNLLNGNIAGYREFLRLITYLKLTRDYPLRNNIYAFNASRTRFYPYQFKPLIKFLDSPSQRLLICDEVGLGKTIEAGLILTELRARQTVDRVLVICPANLTAKWKLELRNRFGEDFINKINLQSVPTRYPEDFKKLSKEFDKKIAELYLKQTRGVIRWLKQNIPQLRSGK